jgi:hypothetical protein
MGRSRWVSDTPDKLLAWFNRMIRRVNLKGKKNTLGKRFGYLHAVCAAFLSYHSFSSRLNGSGGKKHTTESAAPGLRRTRSTVVVIQQRDLGCEPNGKNGKAQNSATFWMSRSKNGEKNEINNPLSSAFRPIGCHGCTRPHAHLWKWFKAESVCHTYPKYREHKKSPAPQMSFAPFHGGCRASRKNEGTNIR